MSIKAVFLLGQTEITVNGLHQWDYGQQLEIHAPDLPALVEVHFACIGMKEAVVRPCSVVNGVGTVAIPDQCLEQTAPIMAWIYEIDGTTGATVKTAVLKVAERARPASAEEIPVEVYDKYTEAITAMNAQIETLKDGSVVVQEARHAESAGSASSAKSANYATKAGEALTARGIDAPDGRSVQGQKIVNVLEGDEAVPFADGAHHLGKVVWEGMQDVSFEGNYLDHLPLSIDAAVSDFAVYIFEICIRQYADSALIRHLTQPVGLYNPQGQYSSGDVCVPIGVWNDGSYLGIDIKMLRNSSILQIKGSGRVPQEMFVRKVYASFHNYTVG